MTLALLATLTLLLILLGVSVLLRWRVASGWLAQRDRLRSDQTVARIRKSGWVAVFAVGG